MTPVAESQSETQIDFSILKQSPKELKALSARMQWSLNEAELSAIQDHYKAAGRELFARGDRDHRPDVVWKMQA